MALAGESASTDPKQAATAAIARAQADLVRAVDELDKLPALDVHSIALAAHALNNFLTVTRGAIELLLPRVRDHSDPQVTVWLEGLVHATELMGHTVSQLMNRSFGTETILPFEDVELARLVERTCAYYRRGADMKGIELTFTTAGDLPLVRTDRVLVAAILDNLPSNAVKYTPPGKRIWVTLRTERERIVCSVRDEGPGLSPAEQERLFLPGVRLGPKPSSHESSTGYGLAIAKRFAGRLGGDITCVTAAGTGATFSLWLPRTGPTA